MATATERPVWDPRDKSTQDRAIYGPGFGPSVSSRAVGHPDGTGRALAAEVLAEHLFALDAPLITAQVTTTMTYQPVTVAGFELKLEPLLPSIGTVVHGCDLASLPAHPELVVSLFRQSDCLAFFH